MCYFVLVACRPNDVEHARAVLGASFRMSETENYSLRVHLPSAWRAWSLADDVCGCNLYSDPALEAADPLQRLEERIARFRAKHAKPKYRKFGWSDAKIGQPIEQMRADYHPRPAFVGLRSDLRRALADLAKSCGSIRVGVHFFQGSIDEEEFALETDVITVTKLMEDDAAVLPDTVYEIQGRRKRGPAA